MSTSPENSDHSEDAMDHDHSENNFFDHNPTHSDDTFMNHFPMVSPLNSYYTMRCDDPYIQPIDSHTTMSRIEGLEDKMDIMEEQIRGFPALSDLEKIRDQVRNMDVRMENIDENLDSAILGVNEVNRDIAQEIRQLKSKVRSLENKAERNRVSLCVNKYRLNKLIKKLRIRMR